MNLAAHKHHKLFGFTLREQLESGKWGATYLGVDESTETEVEIKIIDALSGISSNVREQIIQEVDAQLTLNHPAIIKLLKVDIEENLLCLVFERVNGQSLNQAIKLRGPLPVNEALELFGQVLSAIHHVHRLGIIHRQLTTSNIFIQKEGTLKICNFGVVNSRGFQYYKSAGHSPIKNEISCQSDIYSLSIILLELLSGTLLANHGSLHTIPADLDFQESLLNEPSEILAVLGDVPASVSTAISKALSKAPENRYTSCQEFAQDLGIKFASSPKFNEQRNDTQSDFKVTSIPLSRHSRNKKFAFNILYLSIIGLGVVLTFDLLIKLNAELAYHKGSFAFKAKNMEVARLLFKEACDGEFLDGCNDLAYIEEKANNIEEAYRLYQIACKGDQLLGCYNQANLELTYGDRNRAINLYKRACDGGELAGCVNLSSQYRKDGKLTEAKILIQKACDGGELSGCVDLGYIEEEAGNLKEARNLYKRACTGFELDGCVSFGVLEQMAGNLKLARTLYQKGCDGEVPEGCFNLGLLEQEIGNKNEAQSLFQKACNDEIASACDLLEND